VYDDFAHHPTAVKKRSRRLRGRHRTAKLFAVFEPRSATACRRMHQDEYTHAFDAADESDLGTARALQLARVGSARPLALASDLSARGKAAQALPSVDAIVDYLA